MDRYYFAEDEPRERLAEYSGQIGQPVSESASRASSYQFGGGILS